MSRPLVPSNALIDFAPGWLQPRSSPCHWALSDCRNRNCCTKVECVSYRNSWEAVTNVSLLLTVGQITLASSDPFAFPHIDPAFFSSPFDQLAMLYAIKSVRRFVESTPWDGFVIERFGPVGTAETDEEIMAAARGAARSIFHPTSTARMSPLNATWGVTDPQLRVKRVAGLRIVDASVFVSRCRLSASMLGLKQPFQPSIPAAHPQAAVYILAERAADIIKAAWA